MATLTRAEMVRYMRHLDTCESRRGRECSCGLDAIRAAALAAEDTETAALRKRIAFLKDALARLANFNPDWDMLQATRESLTETQKLASSLRARVAQLEAALRKVEWVNPGDGSRWCFACDQELEYGHDKDCVVETALTPPPATKEIT